MTEPLHCGVREMWLLEKSMACVSAPLCGSKPLPSLNVSQTVEIGGSDPENQLGGRRPGEPHFGAINMRLLRVLEGHDAAADQ